MAPKRGAGGLKNYKFSYRVDWGVDLYVILVVESEFHIQKILRPKGGPQFQDGGQNGPLGGKMAVDGCIYCMTYPQIGFLGRE